MHLTQMFQPVSARLSLWSFFLLILIVFCHQGKFPKSHLNLNMQCLFIFFSCFFLKIRLECGEGRALRAARCMAKGRDVPMDVCKKYHPLTGTYNEINPI